MDTNQQKAVETRINSVVSAGAGSGKTTVLSERFAYLVSECHIPVDRILTLTFTKKATVEMYGRIYRKLKEKSPQSVKNFYKAHIQTLDSYCSSIARLGAHFYGLSPNFTMDKDSLEQNIRAKALPFILEHRNNIAIKSLISTKNYEEIADSLLVEPMLKISTVSKPIDFYADNKSQCDYVIKTWNKLAQGAANSLENLKSSVSNFKGKADSKTFIKIKGATEKINLPEPPVLSEEIIKNIDLNWENPTEKSLLLKDFTDFALGINSAAKIPLPGNLKNSEFIRNAEVELRDFAPTLTSIVNFIYGHYIALSLIELLENFQQQILRLKRTSGKLTFADISSLAVSVLKEHPEIRQIEKSRYDAIMIDEFQDNNLQQKEMLFLLSENLERMEKSVPQANELLPDKLFFVGDEKQSIYRFRGADVSVFRNLSSEFKEGNMELKRNYRSQAALIASFNTLFGGIPYPLAKEDSNLANIPSIMYTENSKDVPLYEAIYREVEIPEFRLPKTESEKKEVFAPRIHIALGTKSATMEKGFTMGYQAEAIWVARKIKKLVKENDFSYQDIAILLRTTTLQPLFERTFLDEGIPYSTESITGFFNDGPVNDLFAFLRICAYPNDKLAYAKVLRSPFVNLNAIDTENILAVSTNLPPFDSSAAQVLSSSAKENFLRGAQAYNELLESCKTESLPNLVSILWYKLGYCYETQWNSRVKMYNTLYDRIFELARQAENSVMSLGAFVDSVRTYEDETMKLQNMDIPLEQKNGVHIMTIHASKGLEFPVVFLCNVDHGSQNEKNVNPIYYGKKFGISVNTEPAPEFSDSSAKDNIFFAMAHNENVSEECAELRRLLYVGATRAEDFLYITGIYNGTFENSQGYVPGGEKRISNFLQMLLPALEYFDQDENSKFSPFTFQEIPPQEIILKKQNLATEKEKFIAKMEKQLSSKKILVAQNEDSIYVQPSHLGQKEFKIKNEDFSDLPYAEIDSIIESTRPSYSTEQEKAEPRFGYNNFGTIAHTFVEAAINGTQPLISNKEIAGLEDNQKNIRLVKEACSKMAEDFISSQLGKNAMAAKWLRAEFEFKSRIKNKILRGSMDLVFENPNSTGTYTIVDYKTEGSINPREHSVQLACYRYALSQIMNCPEENISCIIWYLRYNQAVPVDTECNAVNLEELVQD